MYIGSEQRQEQNQFESLIQGLIDNNYGCSNNFVNHSTVLGLRNNLNLLTESNQMQSAGIGNKKKFQKDDQFRGDKIKWIEEKSEDLYEAILLKKVGNFISHLNKTCFTSINQFESHYASYGQDSFYKRHLDQFQNDKGRQYSIILYLNDAWQKEDGGMLSLYPEGGQEIIISPIGGRIVFFRSDEMEHEVHPSHTRERLSIAGWFKS